MNHFDRVLIDPTPAERDAALQEAAATANARAQLRMVEWPPESYAGTVAEVEATPSAGASQDAGSTGSGMLIRGGVMSFRSNSTQATCRTAGERQA